MEAPSLDIAQHFKVAPPLFVRKVDRATHWGSPEEILDNVFPIDEDGSISFWRIDSIGDLETVAIAVNANRVATNPKGASFTERLTFVGVKEEEFGGIRLVQSP